MTIPTILAAAVTGVLFTSVPVLHIALKNKPKLLKTIAGVMLGIYMIALATFTMCQVGVGENVWINFAANGDWFSKTFNFSLANIQITDFLINIALTFPIGYATATITKDKGPVNSILKGLAVGFLAGLTIELLQFALPVDRSPSLSDIVLNSLSGVIGSAAYVGTSKIYDAVKNGSRKNKIKQRENTKDLINECYAYITIEPEHSASQANKNTGKVFYKYSKKLKFNVNNLRNLALRNIQTNKNDISVVKNKEIQQ